MYSLNFILFGVPKITDLSALQWTRRGKLEMKYRIETNYERVRFTYNGKKRGMSETYE